MQRKHTVIIACLLIVVASLVSGGVSAQTAYPAPDTSIFLEGMAIRVDGPGVTVAGSTATISAAGTYRLTGTLADGQIVVDSDADGLVTLILDGVTINSSTSAPIFIRKADEAAVIVADGTHNSLTDAANYVYADPDDDEPNAALFSDDALTIYGAGSLTVTGNFNDGIASKDTLTIRDATITVSAADDGIRGKDALSIDGAQISIDAQGDGLKADNDSDTTLGTITIAGGTFSITAGGDAIQAQTTLTISGGVFTITTAGGSRSSIDESLSAKGLKAASSIVIDGGTFALNTADDAVHANERIVINGGAFTIATGDDGIHADASVEINGGSIHITESYEGIESAVITINSGDIRINASDDGLNVAGGVDGSGFMGRMPGGMRGGQMPGVMPGAQAPDGQMPPAGQIPGGQMPPTGQMPGGFAGASADYRLIINGGSIVINADGDGLDANGFIEMHGGSVLVTGPTVTMNSAIDYDGGFSITGGFLLAVGSVGMAQAPDTSSTQYSLAVGFDTALPAGTLVNIQNSAGQSLVTFAPDKPYQSLVFSAPQLAGGETYTIYQGGTASGAVTDGLYTDGVYSGGSPYTSLTLSDIVTQAGMMGGRGFGRR